MCPLPQPASQPPLLSDGAIAVTVCVDESGDDVGVYVSGNMPIAGFQLTIECDGEDVSDLSVQSLGSAIEEGFQVSAGMTGTIVGISLAGDTIPPTASDDWLLLTALASAGALSQCEGEVCAGDVLFSDVLANPTSVTNLCPVSSLESPPPQPPSAPFPPPLPPSPPLPPTPASPVCVASACEDSTTYSGALGSCSAPVGPGPCLLGGVDAAACPVGP